jgi:hypothetical protein
MFVRPGVVFATPQEKHIYLFGADSGAFPVTLIVGKIDVEAQVNGVLGAAVHYNSLIPKHRIFGHGINSHASNIR